MDRVNGAEKLGHWGGGIVKSLHGLAARIRRTAGAGTTP